MIVMAFFEVIGVSSIMPFMSVVSNPDVIESNKWIKWFYNLLNFQNTNRFLIFLGVFVLIVLIINNIFTALATYYIFKFTWLCNHSISKRLLSKYLKQQYIFFLNRNTTELVKNILDEVRTIVVSILLKIVMIIKNVLITVFIFFLLLYVNPLLSITVSITLGGIYALFFSFINRTLNRIGIDRTAANKMRFKIASDALSGIKELKIIGCESYFLNRFSVYSYKFASSQALKSIISQLPKYALEIIAFGGILLVVLFFLAIKNNISQVIPLISLYAFAAYRLMPALQTIFTGVSDIRYHISALDILHKDLTIKAGFVTSSKQKNKIFEPIKIKNKIELCDINFAFPGTKEAIIKNVSLKIQKNERVGLVGATGAGKTTIIDIIIGLLIPTKGSLVVDDLIIKDDNLANWQRNIGYVPQNIFIYDDTIANNIALGVSEHDYDMNMNSIIKASQIAQLHEFVINELPKGYDTIVGERGIRLSGGQRQRIGIARAIFRDPDILVLDEATSALDGVTENAVIETISRLLNEKTIIMIAHRLTTLKNCDQIYFIDNGVINDRGTYDGLMRRNSQFRKMSKFDNG